MDRGALFLAKVADDDDREVALAGQRGEAPQQGLDVGVGGFARAAEEGADGVDDDQAAIGERVEEVVEARQVAVEDEGARGFVGVLGDDGGEAEDAAAVGAECFEPRADGVGEVVSGGEEEDGGRRRGACGRRKVG